MRIWIVLLTALLLAAGACNCEVVDAGDVAAVCDELTVTDAPLLAARVVDRSAPIAHRDDAMTPAPALGRIFRPPRGSFA